MYKMVCDKMVSVNDVVLIGYIVRHEMSGIAHEFGRYGRVDSIDDTNIRLVTAIENDHVVSYLVPIKDVTRLVKL